MLCRSLLGAPGAGRHMGGVTCWASRMDPGSRQRAQHRRIPWGGWRTGGPQRDQQGGVLLSGDKPQVPLLSCPTTDGPHPCQGFSGLNKPPWEAQGDGEQGQLALMHRDVAPSAVACGAGGRVSSRGSNLFWAVSGGQRPPPHRPLGLRVAGLGPDSVGSPTLPQWNWVGRSVPLMSATGVLVGTPR